MNVDPPSPDAPDENLRRQARDAANGAPSGLRGQTTKTLTDAPARLPKRIGQYHIKRVIASGGMGTVYEAVQERPRRTVALKLMKHGIASRSALRRFEYESQILARLRHPGIAQVYEAGTHRDDSGTVPYFAMEYIVGAKPVTDYAKEKKLGTRERMKLFANVCDAVHHGHQKGIIHRDLKPSNILVDSSAQVKIIDFGVARSTDSDMAVTTLQTDVGQLIGTLQYMSPEQCAADPHDIDTRSDVYALGVVLYELLCERLPYEIKGTAIHEATRIIREQEPAKLSTFNKTLRGDVDTIALKALEKDRDRRYRSASELADDLNHFLNNEAISARPPSATYQLRVFARRHKGFFAATAAVFLVLVAGVIVSTSQYLNTVAARDRALAAEEQQRRERERAEEARDDSDAVVKFLSDMLAAVSPEEQGKDVSMREVLDEAAKTIGDKFVDKPLIEARLRHTMGWSYDSLGLYDAAEVHAGAAARIFRRELGPRHRATLVSMNTLAFILVRQGKFSGAAESHRKTYEIQRRVLGEEHRDTLASMGNLANALLGQGKYAEAEKLHRQTLEIRRRDLGEEHPSTLGSMGNLASVLRNQGKYAEAVKLYRKTLEIRRRDLGEEHPATLSLMHNLANAFFGQSKYAEAEKLYRQTLEIRRRVLGDEHPETLKSMSNLASALFGQSKYAEAEKVQRQTLEIKRRVLGEEHPQTLISMNNLAETLGDLGNLTEAEELYRKTVRSTRRALGNKHPLLAHLLVGLAEVLLKKGKPTEARDLVQEALTIRQAAISEDHPDIAHTRSVLGECLTALGQYDEAETLVLESYDRLKTVQGEAGAETRKALPRIVKLYDDWHAAEPGKGYGAKAAEWRAKLPKEKAAKAIAP